MGRFMDNQEYLTHIGLYVTVTKNADAVDVPNMTTAQTISVFVYEDTERRVGKAQQTDIERWTALFSKDFRPAEGAQLLNVTDNEGFLILSKGTLTRVSGITNWKRGRRVVQAVLSVQ